MQQSARLCSIEVDYQDNLQPAPAISLWDTHYSACVNVKKNEAETELTGDERQLQTYPRETEQQTCLHFRALAKFHVLSLLLESTCRHHQQVSPVSNYLVQPGKSTGIVAESFMDTLHSCQNILLHC